jgi:hypothetical protein
MELVHVVSGGFMLGTVDRHSVPDLILYHQHPNLFSAACTNSLMSKQTSPVGDVHIRAGD